MIKSGVITTLLGCVILIGAAAAQQAPVLNGATLKPLGGTVPVMASATLSITGQGTLRWAGHLCAPTAEQNNAICNATFAENQPIVFSAAPRIGYDFAGWAGVCSGKAPNCTVTPKGKMALSANFIPGVRSLTISYYESPTARLAVKTVPSVALQCADVPQSAKGNLRFQKCSGKVPVGTNLSISATTTVAAAGMVAIQGDAWGGWCAKTVGAVCKVTMDGDREVLIGVPGLKIPGFGG